ncbi:MAG: hypothetical protein J6Y37_18575 [Paludibacteraceae bacterium]|nr:hypothetical protein [Paludibacteraceae bacterium]
MVYDYFLVGEFNGGKEEIGILREEDGTLSVYTTWNDEKIGTVNGTLEDFKTGPDRAKVDLSNIDDEKLWDSVEFLN